MSRVQYFYCINCGHVGDFGYERQRGLICSECNYDDICPISKSEYIQNLKQKGLYQPTKKKLENVDILDTKSD